MPLRTKPRWQLPGPSAPYLVVWWHDEAARDSSRHVEAQTALQQLDNWAVSHGAVLQEMDAALKEQRTEGTSPLARLGFNEQLKGRIAGAIQAGRLVVVQAERPKSTSLAQARPQGGVTPKTPAIKRKVSYKFVFTTSSGLRMPYAVAINGVVVQHAGKPGSVRNGQTLTLDVEVDSTVSLYLNSDAHPSHRKNPVFGITPKDRDIFVTITEKTGKHKDTDTPVFKSTKGAKGKEVDHYAAALTGDIWMKMSHKYTEEDAKGYLPATTDSGIRTGVLSIYREELTKKSLTVTCAAQGSSPSHTITLNFEDSANPSQNINSFSLLTDGLTRVHPKAFVVLLEAARKAQIKNLTLSSNWRPLLGSIAHRAGLGVDVSYLEDATHKVTMNRQELRKGTPDLAWVTKEEKKLFGQYETAKTKVRETQAALKDAEAQLEKARAALKLAQAEKAKAKNDPAKLKAAAAKEALALSAQTKAETARDIAITKKDDALATRGTTRTAWTNELDANEPSCVRELREALKVHAMVSQFFDPWYMDANTRDKNPASANEQCTGNETLHAHHLHITIHEPDILA